MFSITPTSKSDIEEIKGRFRKSDEISCMSSDNASVYEKIQSNFKKSAETYSIKKNSKTILIFGVMTGACTGLVGYTWMAATDEIEDNKIKIGKLSRFVVNELKSRYKRLIGLVDNRNETSIKWHEWLGYKITGKADGKLSKDFLVAVLEG